ncbi:MAG TPA: hypothetical protein VLI39_03565 [Sedimentisphaerales bacterium]|nr:hypothetical protein [Sedimentisphaerales bacterium]
MKATTGCVARRIEEDRMRPAAGSRRVSSLRPWLHGLFFVLGSFVFLSGCDKAGVEKAQQEARKAKTAVQQLKHTLALAEKEIAKLRDELVAVQKVRDQLQSQIATVNHDRDEALEIAQKAQESLARASGQAGTAATLQKQVAELNAVVVEQRKQIEELLKGAVAEPVVAPTPIEPNEG